MVPLLARNIELQLDGGAEVVMIFDTAAGELSPDIFNAEVVPQLRRNDREECVTHRLLLEGHPARSLA